MLRYSRQLLSPLASDGISFSSFGPIVEKCSLNALAKSVVLFIETPFTISSLIEEVLLLRETVGSFIVCQVRRESFLFSVNDCLWYNSFAILMLLLTLLRSRLNSSPSSWFFERIASWCLVQAYVFSEVIHGDLFERTRFVRKGVWVALEVSRCIYCKSTLLITVCHRCMYLYGILIMLQSRITLMNEMKWNEMDDFFVWTYYIVSRSFKYIYLFYIIIFNFF